MHPYFGTVNSVLFWYASIWFDAQQVVRIPDPRSMVQLFIDFFLFLLQITAGTRVVVIRISFSFPTQEHWSTNLEVVKIK